VWAARTVVAADGGDAGVGENEDDVDDVHPTRHDEREQARREEEEVLERVHGQPRPRARVDRLVVKAVDVPGRCVLVDGGGGYRRIEVARDGERTRGQVGRGGPRAQGDMMYT